MFLMPGARARMRALLPVPRSGNIARPSNEIDASFMRGYLAGMTMSNDATSPLTVMDISAGVCADSTASVLIKAPAFSKSTGGTFVPGSGNNGMGRGLTIANATFYHVFAIVVNGAPDYYFDTSVTAANAPAGTSYFRRIGSMKTSASAQWLVFVQNGDKFILDVAVQDYNTNPVSSTSVQTITLGSVPTGVKVDAILAFTAPQGASGASRVAIWSPDATSNTAGTTTWLGGGVNAAGNQTYSGFCIVGTNTSAQIKAAVENTTVGLLIGTQGWIDTRGRNA